MKLNNVDIDQDLEKRALAKANSQNLPDSLNGLFNYLLVRFSMDELKVSFEPSTFVWTYSKTTSIRYEPKVMAIVKNKVSSQGLKTTNKFIVNFLLSNFLNNN